jgi:hypothetical protein
LTCNPSYSGVEGSVTVLEKLLAPKRYEFVGNDAASFHTTAVWIDEIGHRMQ